MSKRWLALAGLLVMGALLAVYVSRSSTGALHETKMLPLTPEAAPAASDPFAAALARGPALSTPQTVPVNPAGHDPFKAFLQKQTVSPFGIETRMKQ